jgi:hypothetical protein
VCSSWAQEAASRIVVPPDDLPYALVDDYRVDFTRNGAFVVSRDGRYLLDGGLVYSRPRWSEWGTQIRKATRDDTWELSGEDKAVLVTKGTLHDIGGNRRFSFVQRTRTLPGGLRVSYEITPLARHVLSTCGVTLHFPVARTAGAETVFWPGFGAAAMPEEIDRWDLHAESSRGVAVFVDGAPRVSVVGRGELDWQLTDYRNWGVNVYWLIGSDGQLTRALNRGQKGSLSFDIRLGPAVCRRVAAGTAECEVDAYGRTAVYLDGRKVAEGGLGWDRRPVEWLHDGAFPAESPAWHCEAPDGAGGTVRYGVELAAGRNSAADLLYTATGAGATTSSDGLQFALAVPTAEVVSRPVAQEAADEAEGDGEPLYAVAVLLEQGGRLMLQAPSPWTVRDAFAAGARSYVLSIPARRDAGGGVAARVRIRAVSAAADDEGGPTK